MTDWEQGLEKAAAVLRDASSVALACHLNPDPDALGSMLGLASVLRARGTEVVCSFGNEPFERPRWLGMLPGGDTVVAPKDFPAAPAVMVTLDVAAFERLGTLTNRVEKAQEVIWLDHHASNEGLGTIPVVDPAASSTCEMVVRLVDAMGAELNDDAAMCLYAGLVTDTGRFQYQAVKPATLELGARLRTFAFDHTRLVQALYDDNSVEYLRLLAIALQRVAFEPEADLIWTSISRADLAAAAVHPGETDDLIDVVRTAREADVAAVFKQQAGGKYKASLRSRGSHDVAAVSQLFGGGGHRLAAGYTAGDDMAENIAKLCAALPEHPM